MPGSEIELVHGPMMSGKSTELRIRSLKLDHHHDRLYAIIKHKKDQRWGKSSVISPRSPVSGITALECEKLSEFPDSEMKRVRSILVDEGQFFPDLKQFAERCIAHGINLTIFALNGDFQQNMFQPVADVIPLVNKITTLRAVCCRQGCNEHALATVRITTSTAQIEVGDSQYRVVCPACLLGFRKDRSKFVWKRKAEKEKNNIHATPPSSPESRPNSPAIADSSSITDSSTTVDSSKA